MGRCIDLLPVYYEGPAYLKQKPPAGGGRNLIVVLGPNAYEQRANDANANRPAAMKRARKQYPEARFKAGHILNCDLGGIGTVDHNLTILTASANTAMTKYDNALKRAAQILKKVYEEIYKQYPDANEALLQSIKYGIKLNIVISQPWGSSLPDNCIFKKIKYYVKEWDGIPTGRQGGNVQRLIAYIRKCINACNGQEVKNEL
jgi:hypothetical protein